MKATDGSRSCFLNVKMAYNCFSKTVLVFLFQHRRYVIIIMLQSEGNVWKVQAEPINHKCGGNNRTDILLEEQKAS